MTRSLPLTRSVALILSGLLACNGADLVLPDEGAPASVSVVQGNEQSGRAGEPLSQPVIARVSDSRGRPVSDVELVLSLDDGAGGGVEPSSARSGADGTAAFQVVLGTRIGAVGGRVAVMPAQGDPTITTPVSFTALSSDAAGLALFSGDGQSAPVSSALPEPLVVQVADVFGNPIAGVPIAWTAEGGGAVSEAVVPTDAEGRARVARTLGPSAGPQLTLASAEHLAGSPVTFTSTATAGSAATLEAVSGNGQRAVAGTPLPNELVVRLADPEGNPVAGVAVAWVVGQGAGSAAPETTPTGSDGLAATRWTMGNLVGAQTLTAVVSGVGVVGFTATADPGTPPGLRLATQPASAARRGAALGRQPVVQLLDPGGAVRRQAGVPVTATVAAGGGALRGTTTRTTGADGRAVFTDLALEGPAGRYTLAFSSQGYTGVISAPIDLDRAATTVRITADTPDPSLPGASVRVTYTVTSDGGRPAGNVTVRADDGASCQASVTAGACALALSRAGTNPLTATYEGDVEFEPASVVEPHAVVAAAATTLRIDADEPDPSAPGAQVTIRFTLSSPAGVPPGDVTVSAGSLACSATAAVGACAITFGEPGTYTVAAAYPGAGGFAAARDEELHTVAAVVPPGPSASASSVTVDPATVAVGDAAEVEVIVRSAAGEPLEHVGVTVALSGSGGTVSPLSAQTDRSGRARFTVRSSIAETKTITAVAAGVTLDQRPVLTVTRASSETRIDSDAPDPSDAGQPVEVRVRVRGDGGTPGGQVAVTGAGAGCSVSLVNGEGRCSVTPTTAGPITLRADYQGDGAFAPSADTEDHTVRVPAARVLHLRTQPSGSAAPGVPLERQPEVQLALEGGGDVRQAGVAVLAQVSGGTLLGTTTVSTGDDGRARFTDLAIAGDDGSYTITFSADGFAPVTSEPVELRRTQTRTEIRDDAPDPSAPGQPITVGFRVQGDGGTPTGTVTISAGEGGPSCASALDGEGEGACELTLGAEGEVTLQASYPGDGQFAPSEDTEGHRVEE